MSNEKKEESEKKSGICAVRSDAVHNAIEEEARSERE